MPETPLPIGLLPTPLQAEAKRAYVARDILELSLKLRQKMKIVEVKSEWWYIAELAGSKKRGWVPSQYIKVSQPVLAPEKIRALYLSWKEQVAIALGEKSALDKNVRPLKHEKITGTTFPSVPVEFITCTKISCANRKLEKRLGACEHEVEALLKGAGDEYSAKWLWRESLMWHPDQFARKCHDEFKEEGGAMGAEMFSIIMELAEKERAREKVRQGIV